MVPSIISSMSRPTFVGANETEFALNGALTQTKLAVNIYSSIDVLVNLAAMIFNFFSFLFPFSRALALCGHPQRGKKNR